MAESDFPSAPGLNQYLALHESSLNSHGLLATMAFCERD